MLTITRGVNSRNSTIVISLVVMIASNNKQPKNISYRSMKDVIFEDLKHSDKVL